MNRAKIDDLKTDEIISKNPKIMSVKIEPNYTVEISFDQSLYVPLKFDQKYYDEIFLIYIVNEDGLVLNAQNDKKSIILNLEILFSRIFRTLQIIVWVLKY